MYRQSKIVITVSVLILGLLGAATHAKVSEGTPKEAPKAFTAVLWREPVDIASRDLFYGPGGKGHAPKGKFTFKEEDMAGTSPKFDVVDEDGVRWRAKLGVEARPETVASRFVWAVGYFANEDYFMPVLHVENMQHLHRGSHFVSKDNNVSDVRLKRRLPDEKKVGIWSWAKDPFTNTREWYGLRVLMAVMNNWDLKDVNNSVYQTRGEPAEERYVVTDLGASFGPTGIYKAPKGDPTAYCHSKWIKTISPEFVDFNVPSTPPITQLFNFYEMPRRLNLLWLGHHIPRKDARWMGDLLARLSPQQIRDAFRAGGYSTDDVERFSNALERRIGELEKL
jgi:hypothetical protein